MNYDNWITSAQSKLTTSGLQTARLDALLLLAFITSKSKAHLLAHGDSRLTDEEESNLSTLLDRRLNYEPIAYIIGVKEFYGRDFTVNKSVLVPRPESEDIITLLLELPYPKHIIDVGTGSGALAITAKLEVPLANVCATDNDPACIEIAHQNAKSLHAEITLIETDLLSAIDPMIINDSVILANLPYVPMDYPINKDATHEPEAAIFSPEGGLMHYRRLFEQLDDTKQLPSAIICESLEKQHTELALLAQEYGLNHAKTLGLQQLYMPSSKS